MAQHPSPTDLWARAAIRALLVRIAMAIEQDALAGFALAQRLRAGGR